MSKKLKECPNRSDIRYWFNYDPTTGYLTWRNTPNCRIIVGQEAGEWHKGHRRIGFRGEKFSATRLIWIYMTGSEPEGVIRYLDKNKRNLKWENLYVEVNQQWSIPQDRSK